MKSTIYSINSSTKQLKKNRIQTHNFVSVLGKTSTEKKYGRGPSFSNR